MKPRISKTPIFYGSLALILLFSFRAPRCMEEGERGLVLAAVLLLFSIVNWILETVPIAVTSLTLIALIPFTGLLTFPDAVKGRFGNSIFAFFLGVLLLSSAFRNTDLGKLISGLVFRVFGRSPRAAVLGIMVTGAVLAMLVSEIAAAAIVFPIAVSVWEKAKGRVDDAAIGKALMRGVAWGCIRRSGNPDCHRRKSHRNQLSGQPVRH